MKPLRFSPRADADFDRIVAYYVQVVPEALPNIKADIERGLDLIKDHPERTALVPEKSYRRLVTARYRFKIAYRVRLLHIDILGIYRHQNRTA